VPLQGRLTAARQRQLSHRRQDGEPPLSRTVAGKPFTTRVPCSRAGPSQYAKSFTCQAIRWQNLTKGVKAALLPRPKGRGLRTAVNR